MSTGIRVPAGEAQVVAARLLAQLGPVSERIAVAGSLRRGASDVGDLELLAIPKTTTEAVDRGDLWGSTHVMERDLLAEEIEVMRADGILALHPDRPAAGDRYQRLIHTRTELQVDLFAVRPPAQWGVLFLIRTGPVAYSQAFVTEVRRRGYHVAGGALHVGSLGCGAIACTVVPTPEEADVYRAVGIPFVEPGDRR